MNSYVGYVDGLRVTGFESSQARAKTKLDSRIPALLAQGYVEVKEHRVKHETGSYRSFSCEGRADVELVIAVIEIENSPSDRVGFSKG